jgi:signal transduction histidine kinase
MNIFATNMFVERSLRSIHEGFGLGLPFSKSFLEAQGGTLDVRSDGPGEGSVFKATVPLA